MSYSSRTDKAGPNLSVKWHCHLGVDSDLITLKKPIDVLAYQRKKRYGFSRSIDMQGVENFKMN